MQDITSHHITVYFLLVYDLIGIKWHGILYPQAQRTGLVRLAVSPQEV